MRKIVKSKTNAWRSWYGILVGGCLDEIHRMFQSSHFWSGFRDGFTCWVRVFDLPPRPPVPNTQDQCQCLISEMDGPHLRNECVKAHMSYFDKKKERAIERQRNALNADGGQG